MLSLSEEPQIKGSLQCYSLVQGIARSLQMKACRTSLIELLWIN